MLWRDEAENAENPCLKRINVLTHSMGGRVFRAAVKAWGKYYRAYRLPLIFRNVCLVAADMVNETLEGLDGGLLCETTRNMVTYYASDDVALRASKVANLANRVASRRLGHSGPEDMGQVPKNVYAIDCDDVNTRYDPRLGHSYFTTDQNGAPGVVFNHVFHSISTGRVPVDYPPLGRTMVLRSDTVFG